MKTKTQKQNCRVLGEGRESDDHSHVWKNSPINSKLRELAEIPRSPREKQTSRLRSQNKTKTL